MKETSLGQNDCSYYQEQLTGPSKNAYFSEVFSQLFSEEEEERMLVGLSAVVYRWSSLGGRLSVVVSRRSSLGGCLGGRLSVVVSAVVSRWSSLGGCFSVVTLGATSTYWESLYWYWCRYRWDSCYWKNYIYVTSASPGSSTTGIATKYLVVLGNFY